MKENQILNLISFTLLFTKYWDSGIKYASPDYIKEKFDVFIGVNIEIDITPQDCEVLQEYYKIWDISEKSKINNILLYLYHSTNFGNSVKPPSNFINNFKKYIGNINLICDSEEPMYTLHQNIRRVGFIQYYKRFNRELKLIEILYD